MGKKRRMKHLVEERGILMDQANLFGTGNAHSNEGNAHSNEARHGQMEDASEERLNILMRQIRDIDELINDPNCRCDA